MKRITVLFLVATITVAASAFAQDTQKGRGNNMPTFSDIDLNSDGAIVADELYRMRRGARRQVTQHCDAPCSKTSTRIVTEK